MATITAQITITFTCEGSATLQQIDNLKATVHRAVEGDVAMVAALSSFTGTVDKSHWGTDNG